MAVPETGGPRYRPNERAFGRAAAALAKVLYEKMQHLDPHGGNDATWEGLSDGDREFYVTCVEELSLHRRDLRTLMEG